MWYRRTGIRLVPVGGFGWDSHLILPALVLATRPLAQLARITSVSLSEAAHEDFVRTAWAKGLPIRRVWGDHILPNALVPILTALGVSLRFSLGSLPVVEYFFGWPGLGATLLYAIRIRHTNLVITLALALGVTFMLVNLLLELGYRLVDPRLRDLA
jgi:ABC-type dipeptide/oligopeptide/nickel transport system permease component